MHKADIVIVGAGAVGCAVARELSMYNVKVIVVDKRPDVGGDASKSNSSIICTGFDCPPGTLESTLCTTQRAMVEQVVRALDVPFNICGAVMPAITKEQLSLLPKIRSEAFENRVYDVEDLSAEEILELEPEVNPELLGGLYVPREAVIDPFLFVVAMAENATENSVEFLLDHEVTGIRYSGGRIREVETSGGTIETQIVINAAGLYCDVIAAMVGECDFVVKPRKGQFFILDKKTECRVTHIVYPIPTPETRGKLILPTVHGNILLGPTAEDLEDKKDHSVTADRLCEVEKECRQLVPGINISDAITQYCGLRPNRIPAGFHIGASKSVHGYIGISGVRSTGVSSCLSIAKHVYKEISDSGFSLDRKRGYIRNRRGITKFSEAAPEQKQTLFEEDRGYGNVICRCESVTEAELRQAIHRPVGARSLDSVKRRLRTGMGRCQGGFCGPRIIEILAEELQVPVEKICKDATGSHMTIGNLRN